LLDILKKYGIQLSFEEFVEISGRIAPRFFTISSSNLASDKLRLTASIDEKIIDGKVF